MFDNTESSSSCLIPQLPLVGRQRSEEFVFDRARVEHHVKLVVGWRDGKDNTNDPAFVHEIEADYAYLPGTRPGAVLGSTWYWDGVEVPDVPFVVPAGHAAAGIPGEHTLEVHLQVGYASGRTGTVVGQTTVMLATSDQGVRFISWRGWFSDDLSPVSDVSAAAG